MHMHELAARLVEAEEAHKRGMVAPADRGKELEPALNEEGLDAVLILPRDEKVEVAFPGEHEMHAPAALPIAVGDALPMKIVEDLQQQRQDVIRSPRRGRSQRPR